MTVMCLEIVTENIVLGEWEFFWVFFFSSKVMPNESIEKKWCGCMEKLRICVNVKC